ncbi:Solute carrier family 15 member 2 [Blattella germanica]|nr:Solute carrier family 15 member 2 [Blattella germanica]
MKAPRENVALQFLQCAAYALVMKCRSKGIRKDHWLDYASGKYSVKIISDMKIGSRWTFQASRMDGEFFNMELLPDQMQVINPAIVLVIIPLFDKYIYPFTDKFRFMASPLRKMVLGGILAGLAFVASAVLEMKLEVINISYSSKITENCVLN